MTHCPKILYYNNTFTTIDFHLTKRSRFPAHILIPTTVEVILQRDDEHLQQRRQAMQQDIGPQIDQGAAAAMKDTGFQRSPAWERVAGTFLDQNQNKICAACNKDKTQAKLEVHHMLPFHLCRLSQRPDLEFNPANLMTLCDVHHLYIGHLGDWQSFNEMVRLDVKDVTRNPVWATLLDKLAFEQ